MLFMILNLRKAMNAERNFFPAILVIAFAAAAQPMAAQESAAEKPAFRYGGDIRLRQELWDPDRHAERLQQHLPLPFAHLCRL